MHDLMQDLRFAIRQLQNSPGFACTAIFTVALGICANVTVFGFVDAALIKPLPYRDPSRLVGVFETSKTEMRGPLSYPDYLDWKTLNQVFRSIDAYVNYSNGFTLNTNVGAERVTGKLVSPGFFRTLGVTPVLGHDFDSGQGSPSGPPSVLLSYAAWQKRFGGQQNVLGKVIVLDGIPKIIIGVLPQDFHFAPAGAAEFWARFSASEPSDQQFRGDQDLTTVARLKDGVSVQTALADMKSIARQLEKQYPDSNRDQGANVVPLSDVIVGDVRPILQVLLSGAGLLLLIACINVASLLLARSDSRKREIAVRGALGAAPFRLVRQFATEGLVLVTVGGSLGLVSTALAMQLSTKFIPADMIGNMPYLQGVGLNFHVVAFACAISLIAGVLFAGAPMLRVSLSSFREGLSEGSRGSAGTMWRRFGSNLVVLELGTAMVLLVGAGLLGKSLYHLLHEDTGLKPDHLATLQVEGPSSSYSKDEQVIALGRQVVDRIGTLPGVKSVGIVSELPIRGGMTRWFHMVGRPNDDKHHEATLRRVSSGYFTTVGARLLRGRYFAESDDESRPPVMIINETMARQYFPGEDPIDQQIRYAQQPRQIVGIVDDIKENPLDTPTEAGFYVPFNQEQFREFAIVVRTSQAEQRLLPSLATAIHQIDADVSVHDEMTMTDLINGSPSAYLHRSSAWLVGSFATIAFLLSVVGLYGVVAYSVSQRTREIGVRMALGAQRSSVYQLILGEAVWLGAMGIGLGLIGSLAAARLIRGLLFGIQSWDAPTLLTAGAVLGAASLLASYIPARRAAKVDPMEALRYE